MAINLKNPETERLLKALAEKADESPTEAATIAFEKGWSGSRRTSSGIAR